MSNLQSLDKMRQLLTRRGLPRAYVERVVKEFDDHRVDIVQEQRLKGLSLRSAETAAVSRLGDPHRLAETVIAQYQARSFFGRHPVITFLLGPIPLVIAAWASFFAASVGLTLPLAWLNWMLLGPLEGSTVGELHGALLWTVLALHYASSVVPWALAAMALCALARYSGRGAGWLLTACALVGVVALLFQAGITSPVAPSSARYFVALRASAATLTSMQQLFQAFVPFAVFALFLARNRYTGRFVETA